MNVRLPTSVTDWRLMGRTIRLVLGIPAYATLAVLTAAVSMTLIVVAQNGPLVGDVVVGGSLPLETRFDIMRSLYPFMGPAFDALQGTLLVSVVALTGVDVAMVVYHFREHGVEVGGGGASAAGAFLGALGAGCAACGSAILLGLFGIFGVSVSTLWLPLDGLEFALLGIVVLTLSIHWLASGMRGGEIRGCPVDV